MTKLFPLIFVQLPQFLISEFDKNF